MCVRVCVLRVCACVCVHVCAYSGTSFYNEPFWNKIMAIIHTEVAFVEGLLLGPGLYITVVLSSGVAIKT